MYEKESEKHVCHTCLRNDDKHPRKYKKKIERKTERKRERERREMSER